MTDFLNTLRELFWFRGTGGSSLPSEQPLAFLLQRIILFYFTKTLKSMATRRVQLLQK
jgi:hypothetical protein